MTSISIPLERLTTAHICCQLVLNGKPIFLLVDTGASNSCVGQHRVDFFDLHLDKKVVEAAGAGHEKLTAQKTDKGILETVTGQRLTELPWMVLDLEPINTSLAKNDAPSIDGILGAELLQNGQAQIDYQKAELRLQF